jgi:hypothetical protein
MMKEGTVTTFAWEVSKFATVQVMKFYGAVDLHLFLTLVRYGCVWSALRAGYFIPGGAAPVGFWGKPRKT